MRGHRPGGQRLGFISTLLFLPFSAATAQAPEPPSKASVVVTEADAMVLAQEAIDRGDGAFLVSLRSLRLTPPRVAIEVSVAGICTVQLIAEPVLQEGQIGLTNPEEERDGLCFMVPTLKPKPWDLARRIQRDSCDPALPGPRIPGLACQPEGRIRLTGVMLEPDGLHVDVDWKE